MAWYDELIQEAEGFKVNALRPRFFTTLYYNEDIPGYLADCLRRDPAALQTHTPALEQKLKQVEQIMANLEQRFYAKYTKDDRLILGAASGQLEQVRWSLEWVLGKQSNLPDVKPDDRKPE
jgi:hypothetical protein